MVVPIELSHKFPNIYYARFIVIWKAEILIRDTKKFNE